MGDDLRDLNECEGQIKSILGRLKKIKNKNLVLEARKIIKSRKTPRFLVFTPEKQLYHSPREGTKRGPA